jgi:hypothetical protein
MKNFQYFSLRIITFIVLILAFEISSIAYSHFGLRAGYVLLAMLFLVNELGQLKIQHSKLKAVNDAKKELESLNNEIDSKLKRIVNVTDN